MRSKPMTFAVAFGFALLPCSADAAVCGATATSVAFGAYDPISGLARDGVGAVKVSCDVDVHYTIHLSPGSGSYVDRTMSNGVSSLHYNLYTDASRMVVWGDGGSTGEVAASASASIPVYGRIPGAQTVTIGTYVDTIMVTLTY